MKRSEETKDFDDESTRPIYKIWIRSRLNTTTREMIEKNRHYLWAFGNNNKGQRALSVQLKKDIIDFPDVSFVPSESKLGDAIGYITEIVSGQEHTVCLTDFG